MRRTGGAGLMLGAAIIISVAGPTFGQSGARTPIVTTPRFALHSDFDSNLNDALIAAGVARKASRPELFRSGTEVSCFGALPPSARAGWDRAVDYYAEIISPADWIERQQYLIRVQLAEFDEELTDAGARQFVDIARGFRAAAAPAYRACRWPSQDETNRQRIAELRTRLAADEQRIASRLEQLYQKRWAGLPIPVDIVETVNWSGANSILRGSGGGHLLVSTSYQGPAAVEIIFHEASHLLMGRRDPIRQALDSAALSAGYRLPDDLWHVVLFYTTGEVVRRILDERGSAYRPMLHGIFDRGSWVSYRAALEGSWRPYLDGQRTLSEAAEGLVAALRRSERPERVDDVRQ